MVNLLLRSGMFVVFVSGVVSQPTWGQVSSAKQANKSGPAAAIESVEKTAKAAPSTPAATQ